MDRSECGMSFDASVFPKCNNRFFACTPSKRHQRRVLLQRLGGAQRVAVCLRRPKNLHRNQAIRPDRAQRAHRELEVGLRPDARQLQLPMNGDQQVDDDELGGAIGACETGRGVTVELIPGLRQHALRAIRRQRKQAGSRPKAMLK